MKFKYCTFFWGILLLWWSHTALAACYFDPTSSVQQALTVTVPLHIANVTVGPDYPNGSVVYRQAYSPSFASGSNLRITCDTAGQFYINKTLPIIPLPRSGWNADPYAGNIYETGIPGLGVAITYGGYSYVNGQPFPNTVQACAGVADHTSCDVPNTNFGFVLTIIKTGVVSPGTLSGASLPCANIAMGTAGNDVDVVHACFSGGVNIVSKTCQTPDVYVELGTHDATEFSGQGSATQWVNANIHLKDCPIFYGENRFGGTWSDNNVYTPDRATQNQVWFQLTPTTTILDSVNGIMDVDKSDDNAAEGIGIQIAMDSSGTISPLDFNTGHLVDLPTGQQTDITLPIMARYVQTATSARELKPGIADGKLTFLIDYF
ncbi:fimbrial protein [Enterobacter hormaechei subsp. hormaechei]|uniref:fimbrial protein n=1 Tax=Enterobacter hormaechei TaxID=158836 RepID=UPI0035C5EEC0